MVTQASAETVAQIKLERAWEVKSGLANLKKNKEDWAKGWFRTAISLALKSGMNSHELHAWFVEVSEDEGMEWALVQPIFFLVLNQERSEMIEKNTVANRLDAFLEGSLHQFILEEVERLVPQVKTGQLDPIGFLDAVREPVYRLLDKINNHPLRSMDVDFIILTHLEKNHPEISRQLNLKAK